MIYLQIKQFSFFCACTYSFFKFLFKYIVANLNKSYFRELKIMHFFGNLADLDELMPKISFNLETRNTDTNLTAIDLNFYLRTSG